VFLFEKNINPLQMQKNNREFDTIIQECILLAIRDSIPTESIIRAYMEESVEQEEEVFIEPVHEEAEKVETISGGSEIDPSSIIVPEESIPETVPAIKNIDEDQVVTRLTFNEMDSVMDNNNVVKSVSAPKNIERLEEISSARAMQRRLDEEEEDEDRIKISGDTIDLSGFDVLDNDKVDILSNDFMLDGIEELA
jgi:hypothetical protein